MLQVGNMVYALGSLALVKTHLLAIRGTNSLGSEGHGSSGLDVSSHPPSHVPILGPLIFGHVTVVPCQWTTQAQPANMCGTPDQNWNEGGWGFKIKRINLQL